MKLYKEVLIEYTEQAEALPAFTVARCIDRDVRAAIKTPDGIWESIPSFYGEKERFDEDFIGWTALVPVEAEEETAISLRDSNRHAIAQEMDISAGKQPEPYSGPVQRRLVTPWEAA